MAGALFGLGLMQQFDANGVPLSGAKLFVYQANTSTPVTTYSDFALSLPQTHPLVLDSAGRIPAFWVEDGSYRARLTDVAGNEIFDESSITAIGPSSGTSSGTSTDPNAVFQTGDFLWQPISATRTGWVRANGRTIGGAASGGAERAASDVEELFLHLWNNYTDTICPVTGGRGLNAAADWAANKTIATPDMRGRAPFGLDTMGNSAAGVITGGTTAGGSGGAEDHALSIAELASHTHTGTTSTDGSHTHSYTDEGVGNDEASSSGHDVANDSSAQRTTGAAGDHNHTFTTDATGSGTAHNNMPPYRLGTWFIRL